MQSTNSLENEISVSPANDTVIVDNILGLEEFEKVAGQSKFVLF